MAESQPKAATPLLSVLTLAFAAGGLFLIVRPLTSSRPASESFRTATGPFSQQDVDARLWQDPFDALRKRQEALGLNRDTGSQLAQEELATHDFRAVRTRLAKQMVLNGCSTSGSAKEAPLILAVMVASGPYVENTEQRIRSRTAVVQALHESHFDPSDSRHIGYFTIDWPESDDDVTVEGLLPEILVGPPRGFARPLVVPFEWFAMTPEEEESHANPDRAIAFDRCEVVVLWLSNEAFANRPLSRLAGLFAQLGTANDAHDKPNARRIAVVGPADSAGLRAMLNEKAVDGAARILRNVSIYAATPTAKSDSLFNTAHHTSNDPTEYLEQTFAGLKFERTIATDDRVAQSLVGELTARNLWGHGSSGRIAILTEEDSVYGRALQRTYKSIAAQEHGSESNWLRNACSCDAVATASEAAAKSGPREEPVLDYSYLAGIDGRLPGAAKSQQESRDDKNRPEEALLPKERTEGLDQSDYLRRLADRLKDDDLHLRNAGEEGIVAVGLLGADVFDKLMILRALRKQLPGAVFFTNNLDARFLNPDEWEATHNLIVGSPYGLSLKSHDRYPPFRDSYQTATFAGTLRAMGTPVDTPEAPHRYEIGLGVAHELDAPAEKDVGWGAKLWTQLVGILVFGACIGFWAMEFDREAFESTLPEREPIWWQIMVYTPSFIVVALVLIGVLLLVLRETLGPQDEPVLLLRGISVWPSEALRLLAGLLAIHFIVRATDKIRESDQEITKAFDLEAASPEPQTAGCEPPRLDAARIWRRYQEQGRTKRRFARIVRPALLYWLLGVCLIFFFGIAPVPARGSIAWWADTIVTKVFSVGALIVLLFFVIDAMRLNRQFIESLTDEKTCWPPSLLQKWSGCSDYTIAEEYLSERLDVELIAKRTKPIIELIYYPFVVLMLMILARLPYFDDWNWPVGLVILFVLNAAGAVYAGVTLRRAAEKARQKSLERLDLALFRAMSAGDASPCDRAPAIRCAIDHVNAVRTGAFAPFTENPVIGALLLPSGGLSLLALSPYLSLGR